MGPFEDSLLGGLFAAPDAGRAFAAAGMVARMVAFEAALNEALAEAGLIAPGVARAVDRALSAFRADRRELAGGTARDGVVGPALVAQMRGAMGSEAAAALHRGATRQDAIDTALALSVQAFNTALAPRLQALHGALGELAATHGTTDIMGVTRMQPALPIAAAHRITGWAAPLPALSDELARLRPRVEALQLGGPVGDRRGFGPHGAAIAARMAARLGLSDPGTAWGTERGRVVEYGGWLARLTGALGKIGQDAALMALGGELALRGAGGSSAMPHKNNPVAAEVLVTLARFSATQSGGLMQALVAEGERSGAAWTLEWMLLPQMAAAADCALGTATRLVGSIERIGPARG
ncbi:MAG: 3-carboxy-cis,cis-muconate cycloisomerase [Rhodobacteraceae bacterium]|nr:3-carboxy-cis,cis-muconate cycloisomerase [Paracoccaceae bacterium]